MRGLADRQPLSVAAVAAVLAHRLWAAAALVPAERPVAAGQRLADSQS